MKNVSLSLLAIIFLLQLNSYANSPFKVTLAEEIVISDSIVNPSCIGDCNGQIFISYEVGNPDFTPTSFLWKNKNGDIISDLQTVSNLCPGDYRLTILLQNGQDSTLNYSVVQNDDEPPTINLNIITNDIALAFEDPDLGTAIDIIGDSLIAVGITCIFGASDVDFYLSYDFSLKNFAMDNCDLELKETALDIPYDEDYYQNEAFSEFITSTKYFVSDNSGNMDSVEIMFYTAVFYQPIIELIEVVDENEIRTEYKFGSGNVTIEIDQNKTNSIHTQVDPVCVENITEIRWDIDNDGLYDLQGSLYSLLDSAGIFNVTGQAFGTTIQNTFSNEVSFTINVSGFNMWETISPSECGTDCNGDILIDYNYVGNDYEPIAFTWKDAGSGEIIGNSVDLYGACAGKYELTVEFDNVPQFSNSYSIGEEDITPPIINLKEISKKLTSRFNDNRSLTNINILGDSLIEIGVSCVFGKNAVEDFFIDYEDSLFHYTNDNCDLNIQVTFSDILFENEYYENVDFYNYDYFEYFIASRKYFVTDNSGNMDSIEFLFYTETIYNPKIDKLEVIDENGIETDYKIEFGQVTKTIEMDQNKSYTIHAQVDPVCRANPAEMNWDINNDGYFDLLGALKYFSDSAGFFEMRGMAFGKNIANTVSKEVSFTVSVSGFNLWETISPSECGTGCNGEILIDYNYVGNDYEPIAFTWKDAGSGELIGNTADLYDTCAGNYELTVEFEYMDSYVENFTIREIDTKAPVFNTDSITRYLESTKLNARGVMITDTIGDTLLIDASCLNNASDVDSILNNLTKELNLIAQDECDSELEISADETLFSNYFTDLLYDKVFGSWYFLASKKVTVIDDAENQSSLVLIVYVSEFNYHSPIFNRIISSFNDGETIEVASSDGFELDEDTIELPFEDDIVLIADADPVCVVNDLEIKWTDSNDLVIAEGESIELPYTQPGAYELFVQAFGTVLNNSQSFNMPINLVLNGVDVNYQINLDCENECNNKVTATVNSFGDEFIVDKVEWMDQEKNVVSNSAIATGLCMDDYLFNVYFTNGNIHVDTVEIKVNAVLTKNDVTCTGEKDGSVVIEAVKGFTNYSIAWKDSNNILIGEDDKIENLGPGIYTLELKSPESNCPYIEEFEINEGLPYATALFTVAIEEVNQIRILNKSLDATIYQWDFGDNNTSETGEEEFTHLYQSGGQYEIMLIASNANGCSDTLTLPVEIEVTGLKEIEQAGINIFPNPVSQKILNVQFEEKFNKGYKLFIMDANGNKVKTHTIIDRNTQLNLRDLSDGMYFLLAEMDGVFYKKKILVISD